MAAEITTAREGGRVHPPGDALLPPALWGYLVDAVGQTGQQCRKRRFSNGLSAGAFWQVPAAAPGLKGRQIHNFSPTPPIYG